MLTAAILAFKEGQDNVFDHVLAYVAPWRILAAHVLRAAVVRVILRSARSVATSTRKAMLECLALHQQAHPHNVHCSAVSSGWDGWSDRNPAVGYLGISLLTVQSVGQLWPRLAPLPRSFRWAEPALVSSTALAAAWTTNTSLVALLVPNLNPCTSFPPPPSPALSS